MASMSCIGYTGAYRDPVLGAYPLGNGYRFYLPQLMQFVAPDSWAPFGFGGINPYRYCSGDPINRRDPSGHMNIDPAPSIERLFQDLIKTASGMANKAEDSSASIAGEEAQIAAERAAQHQGPLHASSNPKDHWGHAIAKSRAERMQLFHRNEKSFINEGDVMKGVGTSTWLSRAEIHASIEQLDRMSNSIEMKREQIVEQLTIIPEEDDSARNSAFESMQALRNQVWGAQQELMKLQASWQASPFQHMPIYRLNIQSVQTKLNSLDDFLRDFFSVDDEEYVSGSDTED